MDVTIIGTGKMAAGIATRLVTGGNNVTITGRDNKEANDIVDQLNSISGKEGKAKTTPLGNQVTGDIAVLAVPYTAAVSVVRDYGDRLAGKILIDITNPFTPNYDDVATAPGTSAAEEIAKAVPSGTRVVKAFNTVFAGTLKQGKVAGQNLDVFIAGDDEDAKRQVSQLVESGNMRAIDAGPLKHARMLEGMALLMVSLQSKLQTNFMSAYKIIADK